MCSCYLSCSIDLPYSSQLPSPFSWQPYSRTIFHYLWGPICEFICLALTSQPVLQPSFLSMGSDIRTVLGPYLIFGLYRIYTLFEAVSHMPMLTLSKLRIQCWTWLFLRGLLLHWRQVTFGFLWLMFLLLLVVINRNTAENADSSQPVNLKWEFIPPPCWLCRKSSQCSNYFYWTSVSQSSIKFFLCFLEPTTTSDNFLPHGRDRTWSSSCWRAGVQGKG